MKSNSRVDVYLVDSNGRVVGERRAPSSAKGTTHYSSPPNPRNFPMVVLLAAITLLTILPARWLATSGSDGISRPSYRGFPPRAVHNIDLEGVRVKRQRLEESLRQLESARNERPHPPKFDRE